MKTRMEDSQLGELGESESAQSRVRGAGRVSGQGGQNSARSAEKFFFRLPTLVFSLPTLPYVTVAHPAHRTEADLREKASLATNQEGPSPRLPSSFKINCGIKVLL